MAKVTYELGDLVVDARGQYGVVFQNERVLVMLREAGDFHPSIKHIDGFLPFHPEQAKGIDPQVKMCLVAVITAFSLKNNFPTSETKVNNLRKE